LGSNCALKAPTFINTLVLSQHEGGECLDDVVHIAKDKALVHECIKFGWLMRGLVVFGIHLIGETVFWLKSLYQLGFVRFFGFYFWISEFSKSTVTAKHSSTIAVGIYTLSRCF
jgi:hypothetical protein